MRSQPRAGALLVLLLVAAAVAGAQEVDLTAFDAWARPGFDMAWVYNRPEVADQAWYRIPAERGDRPIMLRSYGFKGLPEVGPFRLLPADPVEFTVAIPFSVPDEVLAIQGGIGLYLAQVGQNYEAYLNGSLFATDIHRRPDGSIRLDRTTRGALLSVDRRYLVPGTNLLVFRLVGDPTDDRTGFSMGGPYLIGAYEKLSARRTEYLDLILIAVYAFFGIYHVLMFLFRPRNRSYIFFGIGTLLVALYFFTRSYLAYDLIRDSRLIRIAEMGSLYLVLPFFLLFFDLVLRHRTSLLARIYFVFSVALAIAAPLFVRTTLLSVWTVGAGVAIAHLVVVDLAMPFWHAFRHYRRQEGRRGPVGALVAVLDVFLKTEAGRLSIAVLAVAAALVFDTFFVSLTSAVQISRYAFLVLVLGTAGVLAGQFAGTFKEIEAINASLDRKVRTRAEALERSMEDQSSLSRELSEANVKLQSTMEIGEKDLRMAVQVQQGFFPASAPETELWDLAFTYLPASGISGDFYDFYLEKGKLTGVLVGDVSGRGIASGLVTVLARSVFQRNVQAMREASLGRVLESIDTELSNELASVENYLSCSLLRLGEGTVEYANAAAPDALLRPAGKARSLVLKPKGDADYKGAPLGREGFNSQHTAVRFAMSPGDAILLCTDGLSESRNLEGEPFRTAGLLDAFGSAPADGDAQQILDYVMQECRFHTSGTRVTDDLTAIVLRRKS
ncbi:MAG TPA: PP2C family protein-serine/threonine phosphatase [Spirochaetales bacterium]|nr:PP2C family protein-serine/threonine phosphatase [Spirochaetales bacterium]